MRIRLKEGIQTELILSAKKEMSWREFASKLGMSEQYISRDVKSERVLLSDKIYSELCKFARKNYDEFIIEKLGNNWGRSKGGLNSTGSTKKLPEIIYDERLAEFVGAVLGDGHVCQIKKGKKIGVYSITLAGDLRKDKDYHINYLRKLCNEIFQLKAREIIDEHSRYLQITSKELVSLFISMGINPGNKIKNQSTIPRWIWRDNTYLEACLRGLIDTDGCIHRMSKQDPNLIRINLRNYNKTLLKDARRAFIRLGFNPSNIIHENIFYLSRQKEIKKYLKEIGFSNKKHTDRAREFSLVI